jgi:glycine/D-amino acid oxidase-like deaminating enzyme
MNQSYWERTSFFKDADYVIIGAGIVGLFAALEIKNKKPSANVLVLERSFLPDGASTKNAGFACFGSLSELIVQLQKSSETELLHLVKKRWEGF